MTRSVDAPGDNGLVDAGTAVIAGITLLAGLAVGASGPLFAVSVTVTVVAGPTLSGLVLLSAVLLGALATAAVVVGLLQRRRPYVGIAVVVACAAFIGGTVVGASLGRSLGVGGWARAGATPRPTLAVPSMPVVLEAPAAVTIRLDSASGFASSPTASGSGGTFGHWCRSGPDSTGVAEVSAADVARRGSSTIWATLQLQKPGMIDWGSSITYPRLVLQLHDGSGFTSTLWTGSTTIVARDASTGTVVFDGLVADPAPSGLPGRLSGQLTWRCLAWSQP